MPVLSRAMMDIMRIVVSQYEGVDATPALPLAAGCLIASARKDPELAGVAFCIAMERQAIPAAVEELNNPSLLGLSLYPWNAAYSLAVASAAREAYPDCLIIAGGPSVPRRPDRVRRFLDDHPAIDVLVFGEGELTFRELLRARWKRLPLDGISGIAFRHDTGSVRITDPPSRVLDFTSMASPFLDGTFDALLARYPARFHMALCETNRGCPFSCTFCDWSLTKKVVEFPLERVHAELDWVVARGFTHVMLADANFGIRPRDTGIARRLVELRRLTGAPASFYFYLTKNNHGRNLETIEILQAGGIGTWVGLAVQDFDDGVLEAVKRDNIQTGEAMKLRAICGERGIPTFNELILGLPGQTYQTFKKTIAIAMAPLPRHDFVLFLCRLIDNTELGDPESRQRFGIETRRCQWKTSTPGWDAIVDEFQEVVVGTHDMPLPDWRRTYKLAFLAAAFYNLRLLRVVLRHVPEAIGTDLEEYMELLADCLPGSAAGTVYAEMNRALERYLNSLLAGGPFVLPFGDSPVETPIVVEEAVALIALERYEEFLNETAEATRRLIGTLSPAVEEAFAYQSLVTPRWGHPYPVEKAFSNDWPGFIAGGGAGASLAGRAVTVRFTPNPSVNEARFRDFATNHFACIRARLDTGVVLPIKLEEPQLPPQSRVELPKFVVLPASG